MVERNESSGDENENVLVWSLDVVRGDSAAMLDDEHHEGCSATQEAWKISKGRHQSRRRIDYGVDRC